MAIGLAMMGVSFLVMSALAAQLGDLRSDSEKGKKGFFEKGGNRFRRGGYIVLSLAGFMLVTLLLLPDFEQFPSAHHVTLIGDMFLFRAPAPWGNINLFAAILGAAVAAFLIFAGLEHWKKRRAYIRAILCFLIGLFVLFEAVFQRA